MKYLLVGINAKYIHSSLALHSLSAYVRKYSDINPVVCEYTINMSISEIVQGIYAEAPGFIGFSTYIWNVDIVKQVVRDIHTLLPDTIIYLGGPEVSFECDKFLEANPEVDGIMIGEGEQTFLELIQYYESVTNGDTAAKSLDDIQGICYINRSTNQITTTTSRPAIDLSTVPFPYENLSDFENKIIYYETSRGCPFGCSYCLSSVDKSLRFRDMDLVEREFQVFLDAQIPQVKLVDRTFNIDHKRSIQMLTFLRDHDNGITNFHFEIAGDILTDDEIEIINSLRPGLIQLEIGVQSTNCDTLEAIHRHTDLDKLRTNTAKLLNGGKVHLHLDLIAGLPYEDLASFKESFNNVYSMGSHDLQLGFLKVLKGAPINSMVEDQDIKHSGYAPYEVLSTKYLSYADICELKRVEEMLEIYHNSCQFVRAEKYLLQHESTPYDFYLNLANYYKEIGQLVVQCKRAVRYEILIDYAINKLGWAESKIATLRSLLTLDFYSREKAKARPSFAPDLSMHKANIRNIMDELSVASPSGLFHVEPLPDSNSYEIFDYSKRSPITGNIITELHQFPVQY